MGGSRWVVVSLHDSIGKTVQEGAYEISVWPAVLTQSTFHLD